MHLDGHMDSLRSLDEDRMVEIKQRFFTHDVAESWHFIVDQMNVT